LSREALAELAMAAIDNAAGLVSDARLLADGRRWPRTMALAILGMEELGKGLSCWAAATQEDEPEEAYWRKFRRNLRSHPAKYAVALAHLVGSVSDPKVADELLASFSELVDGDLKVKLDALYVDARGDGVSTPASAVSVSRATEVLRVASDLVGGLHDVFGDTDLVSLVERGVRPLHTLVNAEMAAMNGEELAALHHRARARRDRWGKPRPVAIALPNDRRCLVLRLLRPLAPAIGLTTHSPSSTESALHRSLPVD
ncbi:MAG: AbiV family abortive infection protein, partial [Polyangiaceae bacterium]